MCKRTICIISFILALLMINTASADIVAHWPFDDGSGTIAADITGNGNDGTLEGDPQWVVGKFGSGLEFDGDDFVDCGNQDILNFGTNDWTITAWIKTTQTDRGTIFANGSDNSGGIRFTLATHEANDDRITLTTDDDSTKRQALGDTVVIDGEWYHVAGMRQGTTTSVYVNGVLDGSIEVPAGYDFSGSSQAHAYIGAIDGAADPAVVSLEKFYVGTIDDVRIYNTALTESELQTVMEGTKGFPYALAPDPADGSELSQTWASLSWRPGDFADSHDVYFGDNFDDVNNGTGDTLRGNFALGSEFFIVGFAGNPYPDGLATGTTYYWRIDEVNDADPNSPWKGNVWSFSVPPKTAYAPNPADDAELVDLNARLSWTPGFGAKLHYVVFGDNFDDVNNAEMGAPQGLTNFSPENLKLAKTYYWRIDEFDAAAIHKGQVWSFTTIGAANNPNPANGAVDIKPSAILKWITGSVAASHEVYFGTDADTLRNATTASPEYKGPKALGEESYDPGKLEFNSSYYWRVDEVNDASTDSPWTGNVWSFTTGNFFVIDDFEDYDTGDNQIWFAWHDGLGAGAPGTPDYYAGNGTGSAVGDETTASYTEETIVHGGGKSMPVAYDNNKQGFAYYSEVEHTLTDQRDWTERGVDILSIWFRGISANSAEPLYVAVSNSTGAPAVVVHDDANAAQIDKWTQWIIPLQVFADQGIVLTDVDKIAIGLGTQGNTSVPGGSGKIYIDDIRLYQPIEVAAE